MTIKFFIVAFLYYACSGDEPSIKVHTASKFDTFQQCHDRLMENRQNFQDSLLRVYPSVDRFTVRCVDSKTLYGLQQKYGYKNEQQT